MKNMKSALSRSIANEREAVEDRFSRAESIIGGKGKGSRSEKPKPAAPKPKPARSKIVRDSFTMPADDYRLLAEIKRQCVQLGIEANKGEIVRAGLKLLANLDPATLRQAMAQVERVKTGRPKQD